MQILTASVHHRVDGLENRLLRDNFFNDVHHRVDGLETRNIVLFLS